MSGKDDMYQKISESGKSISKVKMNLKKMENTIYCETYTPKSFSATTAVGPI